MCCSPANLFCYSSSLLERSLILAGRGNITIPECSFMFLKSLWLTTLPCENLTDLTGYNEISGLS